MTLRKKTITIIGLTFICLASVLWVLSWTITREGFTDVEIKEIRKDVERALNVVQNEISLLDGIAHDYAEWDDTYAFVQNRNKVYIQTNFRDSTFSKLNVNFILMIDAAGGIVFGKSFDLKQGGETSFPESLQKELAAHPLLTKHRNEDQSVTGMILFPEGPMIVSSCPILTSEGMGPVRGKLIMGRRLDYFRIQQLARMANLSLMMHPIEDGEMPPDMKDISPSLSAETPIILKALNEDIMAGYALIKDVFGKPLLILRVDQPRAVHKVGQSTLRYLLISLFAGTLVLCLVTIVLLERSVLRKLTGLIKDVKHIASVSRFSSRVSQTGKDELAHLAFEINGMLEKLEAAEKFKEETLEARYRAVVEDQTELICRYWPDGTMTFVNDACRRYYGMEKERLAGLNFLSLRQEEPQIFRKRTASLSPENPSVTMENFIRRAGEVRWQQWTDRAIFDDKRQMIEYQSVGRDITDRKLSEEAIRKAEEKYRTIFEQAAEGIFLITQEGTITLANPAMAEILGYESPEELTARVTDIAHQVYVNPEDRKEFLKELADKSHISGRQYQWYRKDGRKIWISIHAKAVRDIDGRLLYVEGTFQDITKRKLAEDELRKTISQLEETRDMLIQSGKLAAIGQLAAGVAHEVLNPVNIISLGLQLIEKNESLSEQARNDLNVIHDQIGRIVNITKELKQFSSISKRQKSRNNVNDLVEKMLKLSEPQFKLEGIELKFEPGLNLPPVFIDRERMEQVLLNLISNAMVAMEGQGEKILSVSTYYIPAAGGAGHVKIIVSDTGTGISEPHLSKIFDPFFTTKEQGKGTGLGLYISYSIVKEHDGRIWAENNGAKGASFFVELPVDHEN